MSQRILHKKIEQNLKQLKAIVCLLNQSDSKENLRYLVYLARIYLYETTCLLKDERISQNHKDRAINQIMEYSTLLSLNSVLATRSHSLRAV